MAFKGRNTEIHTNGCTDNNFELKLRNCFVCKTLCNNTCGRCGEFYCSKECQSADWQSHRYVCFKMPHLIMGSVVPNNQQNRSGARAQIGERGVGPALPNQSGDAPTLALPNNQQNRSTRAQIGERDDALTLPNQQSRSNTRAQIEGKGVQHGYSQRTNSTHSSTPSLTTEPQSQGKKICFAEAPNNNDEVILVFAKCANAFYIRTCIGNDQYIKDSKHFDQHGRNSKKILQMPSKNDVVLVRHKGEFFRAIVIKPVAEDNIEIALCDIGNTLTKSLNEMRYISDELYNRKRYNFKLILEDLPSAVGKLEWERLIGFVHKRTVFELQFEGGEWATGKNFKLLEKSSGEPLEVLLCQNKVGDCDKKQISTLTTQKVEESTESLEVAAIKKPMEKPKSTRARKVTLDDFTYEALPEIADLVIVDNSTIYVGCVSVILHDNLELFEQLHRKVQKFAEAAIDEPEYKPEPDEMCLAKFGDDWYRALFVPPNCVLIDYGNLESIDSKDIRKFPLGLMDPCYTNFCHIQNFTSEPVQNIKAKLEEKFPLYTFHNKCICSSGDNEPNEYDVTFPVILELLEEE